MHMFVIFMIHTPGYIYIYIYMYGVCANTVEKLDIMRDNDECFLP